jgi:hypothetical protein
MTDEMVEALRTEQKKRMLSSIPEVVRQIVGEFIKSGGDV